MTHDITPKLKFPRVHRTDLRSLATACLCALFWTFVMQALAVSAAYAQRGTAYVRQEESPPSPVTGFPGLLDTNTIPKGKIVANLPFSNLDYGISNNLSVGTYVWTLLPNLAGPSMGVLKARYRLFETTKVASVLDFQGGAFHFKEENDRGAMWGGLLVSNTSYRWTDRNEITVSLLLGRMWLRDEPFQEDPTRATLTGLGLALSYRRTITSWMAIRASVLSVPGAMGSMDSGGAAADFAVDADTLAMKLLVGRLLLSFRAGSWLFDIGAVATSNGSALPWLSISKQW